MSLNRDPQLSVAHTQRGDCVRKSMTLKLAASAGSHLANEIVFSLSPSFHLIVFWSFFTLSLSALLICCYLTISQWILFPHVPSLHISIWAHTVSGGGGEDRALVVLRGCLVKIFNGGTSLWCLWCLMP